MKFKATLQILLSSIALFLPSIGVVAGLEGVTKTAFGHLDDGRAVTKYTVRNASGAGIDVIDLGATISVINVPDRDGVLGDVALGFNDPQDYLTYSGYFGAVVGRYANLIDEGRFSLAGTEYQLAKNYGGNGLHGGVVGFDKRVWMAEAIETDEGYGVQLTLKSPDGEEGYPGDLLVVISYIFSDSNELIVDYIATAAVTST